MPNALVEGTSTTMAKIKFAGFGGVSLAAESYGSADDPGVLLLHGGGQTRAQWEQIATALADAGRFVINLDLRGHGDSEWPDGARYNLDAFVADLHAVLAALEFRPVIVASSMGGWIATVAIGECETQLATGLVLVDAPPQMDTATAQRMKLRLDMSAGSGKLWDPRVFEGGITMAGIESRVLAAASKVDLPTLLVRGGRSQISTPETMATLAAHMKDIEAMEIDDAGHLVALDQADSFSAVLLDFLERRLPRKAPEYREGSDPRTLRDALGCFATGVTVMTTMAADGTFIGLTANSFSSVSLDPPLLLVCLANNAGSLPAFLEAEHFAVNVLHIGQQPISSRFASRVGDRFADTAIDRWGTGVPIIRNALASFECTRDQVVDAGDHKIFIGRVRHVRFEPRRDPLLFFRGRYRRLHFT